MANQNLSLLRSYRDNVSELADIEQKLQQAEVQDAVQSAAKFPYSKHSVPVNGIPPGMEAYCLQIRAQELRLAIQKAKQIVRTLPKHRLRIAVRMYYIEDQYERITWEDVADKIGNGATGESLKKAIQREVKKI